jgi:hypothetical protein
MKQFSMTHMLFVTFIIQPGKGSPHIYRKPACLIFGVQSRFSLTEQQISQSLGLREQIPVAQAEGYVACLQPLWSCTIQSIYSPVGSGGLKKDPDATSCHFSPRRAGMNNLVPWIAN